MFNSKFFKQMKRLSYFLCAALVAFGAASCEKTPEVVDFPVVGPLTLGGTYDTYAHGSQGWVEEDLLGIFVTSDGVTQSNLQYAPVEFSKLEESQYVPGMYIYGDPVLTTTFKAVGEQAGFKQGEHHVYAYTPYAAGNSDYTAIALPDNNIQEYKKGLSSADKKYLFAYAKLAEPLSEYTAEALSFGEFKSPYLNITIPFPTFESKEFAATDKVTKLTITSTVDIAVSNAVINLETGEISGTYGKTIELTFPDGGLELGDNPYAYPTFQLSGFADWETAQVADYTLKITIAGVEYTATGKPADGKYMKTEGNINMWNAFTVK